MPRGTNDVHVFHLVVMWLGRCDAACFCWALGDPGSPGGRGRGGEARARESKRTDGGEKKQAGRLDLASEEVQLEETGRDRGPRRTASQCPRCIDGPAGCHERNKPFPRGEEQEGAGRWWVVHTEGSKMDEAPFSSFMRKRLSTRYTVNAASALPVMYLLAGDSGPPAESETVQ